MAQFSSLEGCIQFVSLWLACCYIDAASQAADQRLWRQSVLLKLASSSLFLKLLSGCLFRTIICRSWRACVHILQHLVKLRAGQNRAYSFSQLCAPCRSCSFTQIHPNFAYYLEQANSKSQSDTAKRGPLEAASRAKHCSLARDSSLPSSSRLPTLDSRGATVWRSCFHAPASERPTAVGRKSEHHKTIGFRIGPIGFQKLRPTLSSSGRGALGLARPAGGNKYREPNRLA